MAAWNDPDIIIRAKLSYQRLQLPMPTAISDDALQTLWENFTQSFDGVDAEDCLIAFENDVTEWLTALSITPRLDGAINAAVASVYPEILGQAQSSLSEFIKGIAKTYTLESHDAVKLGSQLALVRTLSNEFQYSASSITTILKSKIEVERLNTYLVQDLSKYVAPGANITKENVDRIFEDDSRLSPIVFADSDIEDIVATLNYTARTLNMPSIGSRFSALAGHEPYIQMLHWQTILVEFQDFDPSLLYEYSPRGVVAKHLFGKHEAIGLGTGGNPFLNNAKSAYAADMQWAMQKKPAQRGLAIGLSDTLQALKFQSYQGRKSMATLLRWAIHKTLDIKESQDSNLIPSLGDNDRNASLEKIKSWLDYVAVSNTESRGIFEQRSIDYAVACLFAADTMEFRGLGDSVNASNLSRSKFGDEEVIDSNNCVIKAFEPHGGTLTQVYVDEHLRSMSKVLLNRSEALEMVAPISEWDFNVIFVAHAMDLKAQTHNISGAEIQVSFLTYEELLEQIEDGAHSPELFNELVVGALNKAGVSSSLRAKALEYLK